jgi:hypothetical protein
VGFETLACSRYILDGVGTIHYKPCIPTYICLEVGPDLIEGLVWSGYQKISSTQLLPVCLSCWPSG